MPVNRTKPLIESASSNLVLLLLHSVKFCSYYTIIIQVCILQVYVWVIGSNLILRCTWTYKLSAHLRHNYLTVFAITVLEMLRRFQWAFFRVENEWNKMNSKSNIQLSEKDNTNEEAKSLISNDHNV